MSQATTWSVPLVGPASPSEMADRMDKSFDALLSNHSGSARPAYAVAGTSWVSTATAGKLKYYEFDGVNDRLIKTIDTTTGAIVYANGVYAAKSGNYAAGVDDAGSTLRFTAAATLSLAAASVLGNGYSLTIVAYGGAVTIDPNGSETINGATTLTVPLGSSASIICDGFNFFTVIKPRTWEPVGTGFYSVSGVANVAITDLSPFVTIRITGYYQPSVASSFFIRTSTNNGSSYDSGATDYLFQSLVGSGTALAANQTTVTAIPITNNASLASFFTITLHNFNKNTNGGSVSNNFTNLAAGVTASEQYGAQRSQTTARNALQLLMGTVGTFSGNFTVEGIRG